MSKKGVKMNLAEFDSWADAPNDGPEVEPPLPTQSGSYYRDEPRGGGYDRDYDRPQRAMREPTPVPDHPPFVAYVGNLSYDLTAADLKEFFAQACNVTSARLVMNGDQSKGFGYVEFAARDDLVTALEANGAELGNRTIKVDVSEQRERRRGGAFGSSEPSEADTGPWRRGDMLPAAPPQQSRGGSGFGSGGGGRDFGDFGDRRSGGGRGYGGGSSGGSGGGRKKLVLAPRTKPVEAAVPPPADYSNSKSNPFGSAKPRDETAYQKKMEEKAASGEEKKTGGAWQSGDAKAKVGQAAKPAPKEEGVSNRFAELNVEEKN